MKEKKKRTLTLGETLMYAMGIFGIQLFIGYVNSYQSQFYTSMYGDAVSLTAVAVIILFSKPVSAIADQFIGNLIDGNNFKSGKMKPFIFISAVFLAVLTAIMFIKIPFSFNKMQDVVALAYLGMPGLAAIPMFWYKIDGKVKETMRAELALRRAEIK